MKESRPNREVCARVVRARVARAHVARAPSPASIDLIEALTLIGGALLLAASARSGIPLWVALYQGPSSDVLTDFRWLVAQM